MRPPIKERIIGLPFDKPLNLTEYKDLLSRVKTKVFSLVDCSASDEVEISQPIINGIPKGTVGGTSPDWSTIRLGVERIWRIKINNKFWLQLMSKGLSFHFVTPDGGEIGVFQDLLDFYQQMLPNIVNDIDLIHKVSKIDAIFINRMNNDDLVDFIEGNGSSLNVAKLLNFPGIRVRSNEVKPCPPSFQSTSYFVKNIRLRVDLVIPASKPNDWIVELVINGSVQNVRLTADNGWCAKTYFPEIHKHIFSLFKTTMSEVAFNSMNINAES